MKKMTCTEIKQKITQSEKIDYSKANIVETLYIQIDIRKWISKIHGKYEMTVSFKCSSMDLGILENLMNKNFR